MSSQRIKVLAIRHNILILPTLPSHSRTLQPNSVFVSYASNMFSYIPVSATRSTTSSTSATRCSTPESLPGSVEILADDPSMTCLLPEINPLLFKMTVDDVADDESDPLYLSPPLTPIELDLPTPFPAARQIANMVEMPSAPKAPLSTLPELPEPVDVWKAYAFKDAANASLNMITAPVEKGELVRASYNFLVTLQRLRGEYHAKKSSAGSSRTTSTNSSGWDSNEPHFKCIPSDQSNSEDTAYMPSSPDMEEWPIPPSTPDEGDDMHPPKELMAGVHPGEGWHYQTIGRLDYYRFLIPDPATNRMIVAPFINYHMHPSKPQVSTTYGLGLPIWAREFRAAPVAYPTPSLTPNQITLLDPKQPFAPALDKVIQEHLPYNLVAAINQYCYYKDLQYKAQGKNQEFCDKGIKYLECAMEVLSDLENANVLGRIYLAYEYEILENLDGKQSTGYAFYNMLDNWENPIPFYQTEPKAKHSNSLDTSKLHCSFHGWQAEHSSKECPHIHYRRHICYKCHKYRHICSECPNKWVKKEKKKPMPPKGQQHRQVRFWNRRRKTTPW